jgi:hypothetical protein
LGCQGCFCRLVCCSARRSAPSSCGVPPSVVLGVQREPIFNALRPSDPTVTDRGNFDVRLRRYLVAEADYSVSSVDIAAALEAVGVLEVIIRVYGQQAKAECELLRCAAAATSG